MIRRSGGSRVAPDGSPPVDPQVGLGESTLARDQDRPEALSFETVFAAQRDYVYRLACALLGHVHDAEDVTQDVFMRVYKALPSYDPARASLRTWLTRITVNACQTQRRRNMLRRLWQQPAPTDAEADDALTEIADSSTWGAPEERALASELRQAVRETLNELRPEHRAVLVLYYYMDLGAPEIARTLGVPEGTGYSRLHYARRTLQARLAKRRGPGA